MESSPYATRYRQAYPLQPRDLVRHVALSALAGAQALTGQIDKALAAPRVQFLYLHHVLADERDGFRRLLQELARRHRFLSYSEAVGRVRQGPIDAPYLALSFDDGLKSCLPAAEVLEEFGVRACFFVCPSVIGETRFQVVETFCREKLHKPALEFLNWPEVEQLRQAGHEIGSHTLTHSNLAALDDARLEEEIRGSRQALLQRLGEVRHFSWPYGRFRHFSPAAERVVVAAGYESCASAERGCHARPADPGRFLLRRDLVIARWPLPHVLYFLARNSRCAC